MLTAGLDAGVIRLAVSAGTGRVKGRVWHPKSAGGGIWAFAKGNIRESRFDGIFDDQLGIAFCADENGRFEIDGVPTGRVTVTFPYEVFDVRREYTWSALVLEGQATLIRPFDPEGRREFTLEFAPELKDPFKPAHGNNGVAPRETMFWVELTPLSKGRLSFSSPDWVTPDAQHKIVLPDVGPGRYRLSVYDWLGSPEFGWRAFRLGGGIDSEPLFDQEVTVPAGGGGQVRIALCPGSITGKVPALKAPSERLVEVTAVAKGGLMPSQRTRCDFEGNFCVRYLSPGTYSLFIHDTISGFCRVDDVEVPAGEVHVGERVLSGGATVITTLHFVGPTRVPDELVAVGPLGVRVRHVFPVWSSFDRVELAGFWPGLWTLSARCDGEVLATGQVDVKEAGTVQVSLTAGSIPGAEGRKLGCAVNREVLIFSKCKSCPATGSLQPVAIGAAVEETKPSEPSRKMCRFRRCSEPTGRNRQ
jgi:hypothetical protein